MPERLRTRGAWEELAIHLISVSVSITSIPCVLPHLPLLLPSRRLLVLSELERATVVVINVIRVENFGNISARTGCSRIDRSC